jgi:hypothetical protein
MGYSTVRECGAYSRKQVKDHYMTMLNVKITHRDVIRTVPVEVVVQEIHFIPLEVSIAMTVRIQAAKSSLRDSDGHLCPGSWPLS